uniref:NYN domain-containing protein n=1 Tax=Acrocarpospora macrocephala TaxID=150177 RepID=UPI0012D322A4
MITLRWPREEGRCRVDRCALFVDAGYLLADGAMAVHGTRHREAVAWDYPGLLQLLTSLSRERTGLPLLRCYWYEATVEGRRTPEHDVLADIPGLKLRLGRIRPGRREGVDAQVHRDLMTLARNNAVADAVVVSGDEDLAQVVSDAQDLGIRVTVIHITSDGSWAVSRTLRQECDDLIEIGGGHLRPYVNLVTGVDTQVNGNGQPRSNGAANGSTPPNGAPSLAPFPAPAQPQTPAPAPAPQPSQPTPPPSHARPAPAAQPSYNYPPEPQAAPPPPPPAPTPVPAPVAQTQYTPPPGNSITPYRESPTGSHSAPGNSLTQYRESSTGNHSAPGNAVAQYRDTPSSAPANPVNHYRDTNTGSFPATQLGPYTGPQPSPINHSAGTTTLAEAVKAAHKEGHDFGDSIARDAPALWLEAVLARKPRMPSDLEARLLQGSSLPIDFLLHDEVRHALRRGFWDALERARR